MTPTTCWCRKCAIPLGKPYWWASATSSGTLVSTGYDYRVLQPRLVTDTNGNRAAVSFDALGWSLGPR